MKLQLKWNNSFVLMTIMVSVIVLQACENDNNTPLPEIIPSISPVSGNTTTTFEFDLSETFEYDKNQKLFVRWDWEGDSIFDTPFLNEKILPHRYLSKGDFNPIVEILNSEGQTADSSFHVNVVQGYSKPLPQFTVTPKTGNIYTVFSFDASLTKDYEDSLSNLKFRWDFEGDEIWDTDFVQSPIIDHIYPVDYTYFPELEVQDPSSLTASDGILLRVTLLDTCIHPEFKINPNSIIKNEEVIFDASGSYYSCNEDEELLYRWDFENDRNFDTDWLESPIVSHVFPMEIDYNVMLRVKNSIDLENEVIIKIKVHHQNRPPVASFRVSTYGGNTNTSFRFDSWDSRDPEEPPGQLLARWDFNGDGIWDTDYDKEKIVLHTFDSPGEYNVALELTDSGQLKDTAYSIVYVLNNDSETGMVLDKRGTRHEYYGTIKIGEKWWFSRNLSLRDTLRNVSLQRIGIVPYNWQFEIGGYYGYLYDFSTARSVCPKDWHLATKADWEDLLSQYNSEEQFEQLVLGGSSGMNILLSGIADTNVNPDHFSGIDKFGFYWSGTGLSDQTGVSVWILTFDGNKQKIQTGFGSGKQRSVRCVKN